MIVQYPIACDEENNLIDISSISPEHRHDHKYYCPNCGYEMRPRLGEHRAHCFYHFHSVPCDSESYIHRVGKELLYRRFTDPHSTFIVEFNRAVNCKLRDSCSFIRYNGESPCNRISEQRRLDLKGLYDTADIEKEYTAADGMSFRPDVLLTNAAIHSQRPIFLEINYRHPCSEKKILSGESIIEFKVSSIADLSRILSADVFSENNSSVKNSFPVRLYNSEMTCSQDEIIMMLLGKETLIPCTKQYRDLHPRSDIIDCAIFYPSGFYRYKEIHNLDEAKDGGACYTVSFYRSSTLFSPRSIVAKKDARFRDCGICSHFSRKYGYGVCDLALFKSNIIGDFEQESARFCDSFELKDTVRADLDQYVEGRDYFIWTNPVFQGE